jgi:hypothetical protein
MTDARWADYLRANMPNAHIVNVWEQKKFDGSPWTSLCATCGNEGQFASQEEAKAYANLHVSRKGGEVKFGNPKAAVAPKQSPKPQANSSIAPPPAPGVK